MLFGACRACQCPSFKHSPKAALRLVISVQFWGEVLPFALARLRLPLAFGSGTCGRKLNCLTVLGSPGCGRTLGIIGTGGNEGHNDPIWACARAAASGLQGHGWHKLGGSGGQNGEKTGGNGRTGPQCGGGGWHHAGRLSTCKTDNSGNKQAKPQAEQQHQ